MAGTSVSSTSFGADFYTYTYQGIVAISRILASIVVTIGWVIVAIGAGLDMDGSSSLNLLSIKETPVFSYRRRAQTDPWYHFFSPGRPGPLQVSRQRLLIPRCCNGQFPLTFQPHSAGLDAPLRSHLLPQLHRCPFSRWALSEPAACGILFPSQRFILTSIIIHSLERIVNNHPTRLV